jgi:signal transduction histidine kinase/AmiR/NasT family two-component response regulator
MRVWNRKSEVPAAIGVARAANEGLSRRELLDKALSALSTDGRADRVGAWLAPAEADMSEMHGAPSFSGVVWDRDRGNMPAEWRRLSLEAPLPQDVLSAGRSVEQELEDGSLPMIGPLMELRRAMWVPIERRGRLRGVLLAGSRSKHGEMPKELFESAAAELALAIDLEDEQRVARERHADLEVVKQMLPGLSGNGRADTILGDLAANCTAVSKDGSGLGAVFAAIGFLVNSGNSGAPPEMAFHWKSGDSSWTLAIETSPAAGIWHRAVETRRLTGAEPEARSLRGSASVGREATHEVTQIVAIPLEGCGKIIGVLVTGLSALGASLAIVERLELRAALAATALESWKRTQEEIRQAAQRSALLEGGPEASILLDERGRIAAVSASAKMLLNERHGSAVAGAQIGGAGQRLMELFQISDQPRVAAWSARALSAAADRRSGPAELPEAVLSNGLRVRIRPATPAGGPFSVVTLETWRDVENAPADSRAEPELRGVLEWLDEGVILYDAQDNVRALNTRFLQIAGLKSADAADLGTLDRLIFKLSQRVADPWSFAQRWRNLARGIDGGIREELELVRPAQRIVQRLARPIVDEGGRKLGRVEIYRDLTARREFQSRLLRTEKLAALGQLVTGVAHELNNPLASILGYSQRLLQSERAAGNGREVRHIFEEAERATAILRQLLMNAHENKPELRTVALNQVVLQTVDLQQAGLAQENIRVELDLDPALPLVHGDAGQLQQILTNLTGNARQALGQGGRAGTIKVRTRQIGDQRVLLEIADDGPGISAENMEHIFDPFFTTKPAGSGTGLGLAIVLGIVREHGGHINVSSPPQGGAVFSIALRAASSAFRPDEASWTGVGRNEILAAPEAGGKIAAHRGAPAAGGNAKGAGAEKFRDAEWPRIPSRASNRILVVEDEPTVARLIADVLGDEGFQVDVLLDGHQALEQAGRENYDLVICDMKMPGLDGQHFYKGLVQAGNLLSERFLLVTGDVVSQHTQRFMERHNLPHVAKPFRMEELKDQVHSLLDLHSTREARPAETRNR